MKRPSFQFYPSDWKANINLRRCTFSARGVWMDVICSLHDSDEYGILRWPLKDIAAAVGAPLTLMKELVNKGVLKGSDSEISEAFIYTPRSGRKDGEPVTLVDAQQGPLWYSSRMVKDEYIRTIRGDSTRFGETPKDTPKRTPKTSPKTPIGDPNGDGSSSPSSSSPSGERDSARTRGGSKAIPAGPSDDWGDTMPTETARDFTALQARINAVHPHWEKRPHFVRTEQDELLANARVFFDLTDRDWKLLGCYIAAQIDAEWGLKAWQPDNRSQFVKAINDVCGHADRWEIYCKKHGIPTGMEGGEA